MEIYRNAVWLAPSDAIHDALWAAMTREDHGWIDMMRQGTVALANATFPSKGN